MVVVAARRVRRVMRVFMFESGGWMDGWKTVKLLMIRCFSFGRWVGRVSLALYTS